MRILVVGDTYYRSEQLKAALTPLADEHMLDYIDVSPDSSWVPRDDSERSLSEFQGNPDQVREALSDHEVLVVHGAPVTRGVLESAPRLRLVCCVRGGPVNVDRAAAKQLGLAVVTTPGKNAAAVADLTLALALMLARGVEPAADFLRLGNRLQSAFDGARFFGSELSGKTLGLVGCGRVGAEVCTRALGFGMQVQAYDPYVTRQEVEAMGATYSELPELMSGSDYISLHARQTAQNRDMINAEVLGNLREGTYLINTAREGLLDEEAALAALRSGRLAGLGVDVFHPSGAISQAIGARAPGLIALPHIGGATYETMHRAMNIVIDAVRQLAADDVAINATGTRD